MTTTTETTKLSAHTTWLFALGSIATGIAASYALNGLGTKVTAAVYFAIVAIGGFASTYMTRARVRGAVLSFLTGAAMAAIAYYFLVSNLFETATTVMTDAASGGQAHAEGERGLIQLAQDSHRRRIVGIQHGPAVLAEIAVLLEQDETRAEGNHIAMEPGHAGKTPLELDQPGLSSRFFEPPPDRAFFRLTHPALIPQLHPGR